MKKKMYQKKETIAAIKREFRSIILVALYDKLDEYKKKVKLYNGEEFYQKKYKETKAIYKLLKKASYIYVKEYMI